MSELLDALIARRRQEALDYKKYLEHIVDLARRIVNPSSGGSYPTEINSPGKRALFDNLGGDKEMALAVDQAVNESRQDDWRSNPFKIRKVRIALTNILGSDDELVTKTLELIKNQNEY